MAGVLEGIKVIEMGQVVAVPAAGVMLAEWGADVIKLEPLNGEMYRGSKKINGVVRNIKYKDGEIDFIIQLLNRSKRGLALDLKKEAGREVLYRLIRDTDVFICNYDMSAIEKLKVDYDTLSKINSRLVYGVLTGYGTVGPDKDERGFDYSAAWARSGIQYSLGEPGSFPPPQRPGMMDLTTAGHMIAGILAALFHRERTGKGQKVEFSLYHTAVWVNSQETEAAMMGRPLPKHEHSSAPNPLWDNYRAGDDQWFQLVMLQSDPFWPGFCRAIGKTELEKDDRFSSYEAREQNCVELIAILDAVFATASLKEWEKRFRDNGCLYGRVASPVSVTTDAQALANHFFAPVRHPAAGEIKLVTPPIDFVQNPASIKSPAPEVGQHTEEILLENGYGWEEIAELKEKGAIN